MAKPQLEFTDGRPPFDLAGKQTMIGRGAACQLRSDGAGVAEQHARIVLDQASGNFWIEDLKSPGGTIRNGQKLTSKAWLADGDVIVAGAVKFTFRPDGAPAPAAAEQRTIMSMEAPDAVKQLIAKQQALEAQKRAGAAKPPVDDGRTMQADAPQVAAAAVPPRKATVMGLGSPAKQPTKLPPPPASPAPVPDAQNPFASHPGTAKPPFVAAAAVSDAANPFATQAEMPAPNLGGPVTDASNPFATQAEMPAPNLGGPVADTSNPFATQAEMPAPQVPPGKRPHPNVSPVAFEQTGIGTDPSVHLPPTRPAAKPAPQPAAPQPPAPRPKTPVVGTPSVGGWVPDTGFTPSPVAGGATAQVSAPAGGIAQPSYQPTPTPQPMPQIGDGGGGGAASWQSQPYTPPKKGSLGGISRALEFYGQIFSLAFKHKSLLMPLVYDLLITTVLSIALAVGDFFIASDTVFWIFLSVGTALLYFIDYFCNSLTASLIYDQVTTGQSSTANAWPRVTRALPGILTFAAVSAALDVASTYARERRDIVSRILLDILRKIWTTATYVVMPALVLEGVSFGQAFKRSKDLMKQDPTGVGSGIVAMSLTSYVVGIVMFGLAGFSLRFLGHWVHPAVGMFFFFFFCNAFWAVSGWMKIAYSTLFYMWAKECERANSTDFALAPQPLRAALDAA